jgi:hypothetical protein
MAHLAEQVLIGADDLTLEGSIAASQSVTAKQVRALAGELLSERLAVAAVGPVPSGVLPESGWVIPG